VLMLAVAGGSGDRLLRRLAHALQMTRLERLLMALSIGLGALALLTLALGVGGLLYRWLLFGLLATAIQLQAARSMKGRSDAPLREFVRGWAGGMGLRMLGVVLVGVVIWLDSAQFPALPAAMGFPGVLVPLLFFEARQVVCFRHSP